jgi:hypothetical protein
LRSLSTASWSLGSGSKELRELDEFFIEIKTLVRVMRILVHFQECDLEFELQGQRILCSSFPRKKMNVLRIGVEEQNKTFIKIGFYVFE